MRPTVWMLPTPAWGEGRPKPAQPHGSKEEEQEETSLQGRMCRGCDEISSAI